MDWSVLAGAERRLSHRERVCQGRARRHFLAANRGRIGYRDAMARPKPTVVDLADLTPGQLGDFFALLAEKTRGTTRDGKGYFQCRFRDKRRAVAYMAWADGPWFMPCEREWQVGHFYK